MKLLRQSPLKTLYMCLCLREKPFVCPACNYKMGVFESVRLSEGSSAGRLRRHALPLRVPGHVLVPPIEAWPLNSVSAAPDLYTGTVFNP